MFHQTDCSKVLQPAQIKDSDYRKISSPAATGSENVAAVLKIDNSRFYTIETRNSQISLLLDSEKRAKLA